MTFRMVEWGIVKHHFTRSKGTRPRSPLANAIDLCSNFRGIGWDWSRNYQIPVENRPTHDRVAFMLRQVPPIVYGILAMDAVLGAVQYLGPDGFGTQEGGSMYDPTLSPVYRHAQALFITLICGANVHALLTFCYSLSTLISVGLGLTSPEEWPPLTDAPWRATSVTELWNKRWHQGIRRPCYFLAYAPLRRLFGGKGPLATAAGVMGGFLLSGILHDWIAWSTGRGTDFPRAAGFFIIQGAAVVAEQLWMAVTGRKVGGWPGWVWTMGLLTVCGHILIESFLLHGLGGSMIGPDWLRPSKIIIEYFRQV